MTAPALLERRQSGARAHPYGHVHRLHRAAPRHGWRTASQGSRRDRAGSIHHTKQWGLDHVWQTPELTACDTGDHWLAVITPRHVQHYVPRNTTSASTAFTPRPAGSTMS